MGAISYFYGTPTCKAASNAPNLLSMPVFRGRAAGTVNGHATLTPTFERQVTSGIASTVAKLSDMPVLKASVKCVCSFMQTFLTMPVGGALRASMKNGVMVVSAAGNGMAMIGDVYVDRIEWSNPLANDDFYTVLDADNGLVAQGRANLQTVGQVIQKEVQRTAKGGLQITSLISGTLTIYTGKKPRN